MATPRSSRFTRRDLLQACARCAGVAVLPLVAACSGQRSPEAPVPGDTSVATPPAVPSPSAPTKAVSPLPPTSVLPGVATATPPPAQTPVSNVSPAVGSVTVIQQRDRDPLHDDFLRKLVQDAGTDKGWDVDLFYDDAFAARSPFVEQLAASVAGGQGPDLVLGNYDTVQLWHRKIVQSVDDVVAAMSKKLGDPTPGYVIGGGKLQDRWWSVPHFNRVHGWWARKSWFEAKRIDLTTLKDFGQWRDAALRITDPIERRWGWGTTVNRSGDGEAWVRNAWYETGNRLTDETGQKVTFDTDLSIQTFNWLKDLYTGDTYKPSLPPAILAWDDADNNNAWSVGTIGFTGNAGTLYTTSVRAAPRIASDTVLVDQPAMPIGEKQQLISSAGTGSAFYLIAGAKNLDASRVIIERLLEQDVQTQLFSRSQGYATPGYAWGWDTDPIKSCPNNLALIYKNVVFAKGQFADYLPASKPLLWVSEVSQSAIFTDTVAAILKGATAADALKKGQAKVEEIANRLNYQ